MALKELTEISRTASARKTTLIGFRRRKNRYAPILAGVLALGIVGGLVAIRILMANPPQPVIVHSDVPRPPADLPATDEPKTIALPSVTTMVQPINDPTAAPSITGNSAPVPDKTSTAIASQAPSDNNAQHTTASAKTEDTFFGMPVPSSVEKH